ncbi:hypothetical protein SUGI_0877750 [Cryptomeria japonica]|nr:hypothetical protein SUGI_0877750 [Cryptomeria japonica]
MCADTVNWSYVPLINLSDSSTDFVSLLRTANEEHNDYHAAYRFRGTRNYLARQAFLRSYKFCIEESFKDKLRRSIRRLNEESFEELLKKSLRKNDVLGLPENSKSFSAKEIKFRPKSDPEAHDLCLSEGLAILG